MAVTYVWPGTLPQAPLAGVSESKGTLILRTPMDKGPAKMRRRAERPDTMALRMIMDSTQLSTLETFVFTTIGSTARFGFPHPRSGSQIEARLVPNQDGELYTVTDLSPTVFSVSFTVEVLP